MKSRIKGGDGDLALNDEADLEAVERRKAFRERLRTGQKHERLMQELDQEDELGRLRKDSEQ